MARLSPSTRYGRALDKFSDSVHKLVQVEEEWFPGDEGNLSSTIAHMLTIVEIKAAWLQDRRFESALWHLREAIEKFENENHTLRALKAARKESV